MRVLLPALAVILAACSGAGPTPSDPGSATPPPSREPTSTLPVPVPDTGPRDAFGDPIPPAPGVPEGPLDPGVVADLDAVFANMAIAVDVAALRRLGDSGDARVSWLLSDVLRFFQGGRVAAGANDAFEALTGTDLPSGFTWGAVTDWLIAWDLPAPPGYVDWKRRPYELIEPAWSAFFDDPGEVDWRLVSWGGVLIDDRPVEEVGAPCPQGCIPALDDPAVTDAAGGSWYPDGSLVFGVVVGGEARAYPKNIMEVHEMVNDRLGGRRIGVPYCTLCGSAQAFFTDGIEGFGELELRTSGLLSRSNKVMFDLTTWSLFDTFRGKAVSGPLYEAGVTLEMLTVVTSTWGGWKAAHPDTTIVAEDGGIGRAYPADPLQGRDDGGPIFPVGDVDPRLPVQEQVVGVVTPAGAAVAFPAAAAAAALASGTRVTLEGVEIATNGAGLSATFEGMPIASHQAFWFAWSQFHPETTLWTPLGE